MTERPTKTKSWADVTEEDEEEQRQISESVRRVGTSPAKASPAKSSSASLSQPSSAASTPSREPQGQAFSPERDHSYDERESPENDRDPRHRKSDSYHERDYEDREDSSQRSYHGSSRDRGGRSYSNDFRQSESRDFHHRDREEHPYRSRRGSYDSHDRDHYTSSHSGRAREDYHPHDRSSYGSSRYDNRSEYRDHHPPSRYDRGGRGFHSSQDSRDSFRREPTSFRRTPEYRTNRSRSPQDDHSYGNRRGRQDDYPPPPSLARRDRSPEQDTEWKHDRFQDRGFRGARPAPPKEREPNISSTPEQGVICAAKDSYGFIKSLSREEDLFFHYSAVPQALESEIQVGTSVEFFVATDPRDGKLSAAHITILPKGTVKLEEISEAKFKGTLKKVSAQSNGLIEYSEKEDLPPSTISFTPSDLSKDSAQIPLEPGDIVEFNVLTDIRKKTKRAVNVNFVQFGGPRETGVIQSTKPTYGFIECCDRPTSLFFHFNDVLILGHDHVLEKGLEVEFTVVKEHDKASAKRIKSLPQGTVSFDKILPDRYSGFVRQEVVFDRVGFNKQIHQFGSIEWVHVDPESKQKVKEPLSFSPDAVRKLNLALKRGDEVEFSVQVSKRSNEKHAVDIVLIKSAPEKIKDRGIICTVKNSFGYISCPTREEDVYFRFSDLKDDQEVYEGEEVEFTFLPEASKAIKLKHLPKGSVQFEELSGEAMTGKIKRELKPQAESVYGRRKPAQDSGLIVYTVNDEEKELPFGVTDQQDQEQNLWPQDEVSFRIATDKKTKLQSATQITLTKKADLPRETGVIIFAQNDYGFIQSPLHESDLYFHVTEFPLKDIKHPEGMEVEYSLIKDSWAKNKLQAVRLKKMPKGSVKFEEISKQRYTGTIEREIRGRGHHQEQTTGKISYTLLDSTEKQYIEYSPADVKWKDSVRKGDHVEFNIATDRKSKAQYAVNISPVREQGSISALKQNFGFILIPDKSEEIFFHESEIVDQKKLKVGDKVDFVLSYKHKTQKNTATDIRLLPPDTPLRQKPFLKTDQPTYAPVRQPTTSDGTKGFGGGANATRTKSGDQPKSKQETK